jgi:hypothetical protein
MFKFLVIFKIIWIFIKNIKERVAVFSNKCLNKYFLPGLCVSFLRIINNFLLWTNITARHYKSKYEKATSVLVNGYFSHAKNELRQSLRTIDRFVGSNLLSIEGELKMARSLQVNKIQEYKSKNDIKSSKNSDMIYSN